MEGKEIKKEKHKAKREEEVKRGNRRKKERESETINRSENYQY